MPRLTPANVEALGLPDDPLNRVIEQLQGRGTLASSQILRFFAQEGAGVLDVVVDGGFRDPELGGEGRVGGALTAALPDFGSGIE